MVYEEGQAGVVTDIERIIDGEELAIGQIIYEYTDYQETGVRWIDLDDSCKQHYTKIAELINAHVCELARLSLARPTTAA